VARGDCLHHHETNVVAVTGVIGARVAETDEEQHGENLARAANVSRRE
jgi:hypothetical protein